MGFQINRNLLMQLQRNTTWLFPALFPHLRILWPIITTVGRAASTLSRMFRRILWCSGVIGIALLHRVLSIGFGNLECARVPLCSRPLPCRDEGIPERPLSSCSLCLGRRAVDLTTLRPPEAQLHFVLAFGRGAKSEVGVGQGPLWLQCLPPPSG